MMEETELEKDIERETKEQQKNQDDYYGKGSDNCKTWTEIPEELQSKLKGDEYGEVI